MKRYVGYAAMLWVCTGLWAQTPLQEEEDFRFAERLAGEGMHELAAVQYSKYANDYPLSPRAPQALLNAGISYEQADSLEQAMQSYLSILLRYPKSVLTDQAQFKRASLMAQADKHLEAGISFERLRLVAPESDLVPQAQIRAAEEFLRDGQLLRAGNAIDYFLENFPTHPLRLEARYTLARIRTADKEYALAVGEVDRILGDRLDNDLTVKSLLLKSTLLEKMGRYHKADSLLGVLVQGDYTSDSVAVAARRLAKSYQRQKAFDRSNEILDRILKKNLDSAALAPLYIIKGDNLYATGDYDAALASYDRVNTNDLQSTDRQSLMLRKGMVLKQLKKSAEALKHFSAVLDANPDSSSVSPFIQHRAAIQSASILCTEMRPVEAIGLLKSLLRNPDQYDYSDETLFQIGRIQETVLKDYVAARHSYTSILGIAPRSELADDAQLGIARTYEKSAQTDQALLEYRRYLFTFPGAEENAAVEEKIRILNEFSPAPREKTDRAFNDIISLNLAGASERHTLVEWAKHQIFTFKNYPQALQLLKQVFASGVDEGGNRSELLYYLSYCHARLAEKYIIEHQPIRASAHTDTLVRTISLFQKQDPQSNWGFKARFLAVQVDLLSEKSDMEKIQSLSDILGAAPAGEGLDSLFQVLRYQFALEVLTADTLRSNPSLVDRALAMCADILSSGKENPLTAKVLYLQARLLMQTDRSDTAAVLLQTFNQKYPVEPDIVASHYYLALIYQEFGLKTEAISVYRQILDRFFYAQEADLALDHLAQLLIDMNRQNEAVELLENRDRRDDFFGDSSGDESLWFLGQAYEKNGDSRKAMAAFRDYLLMNERGLYRAQALLALAGIADRKNDIQVAIGHYEELASTFPGDTLAELAMVRAADLYFDRGQYERARDLYNSIKARITDDRARHAAAREIICEYKLDRLSRATSLAGQFERVYKDENAEAQFLYEEGLLYIAHKDFEEAEKTFKTLSRKYRDVKEGALGDLGLARLYVILNRTEDALKRLTDIPQKYDDPEVVATAYLNLGDFYYENRQIENCIFACRKVLELAEHGTLRAQALNLLVDSYDDFGLRDQAIAYEREFIELYPDDPSILSKRIRIGVFLYNLKEYHRAIAHLKNLKPLVSAEDEPRVQYWIAKSYADHGDTEQAIIEFLKVKYLSKPTKLPYGATALYEAALGYRKLGHLDKAKELLQQVVRERGVTDSIGRAANEKIREIEQNS